MSLRFGKYVWKQLTRSREIRLHWFFDVIIDIIVRVSVQSIYTYLFFSEKIRTNYNFIHKTDTVHMVRFLRVTYTRPKFGLPPGGLPIPPLVSQKTFIPGVIEVNQSDGSARLEDMNVVAMRIKAWLKNVGKCMQCMVYMMTSSNGNIFGITGPLCGEFTGHRWISVTKARVAELWFFLWSAPSLRWRHNERDSVSNHQPHDCLLNRLF